MMSFIKQLIPLFDFQISCQFYLYVIITLFYGTSFALDHAVSLWLPLVLLDGLPLDALGLAPEFLRS